MLAGAVAVFVTDSEAGPVGLLAVGMILFIIGVARQLPTRLKAGDYEAGWDAARAATTLFADAVEDAAPGQKLGLITQAEELLARYPALEGSGLRQVLTEELAGELIRQIVADSNGQLTLAPADPRSDWDFTILGVDGKKLGVWASTRRDVQASKVVRNLVHQSFDQDPDFVGALVVLDSEPNAAAKSRYAALPGVHLAVVGEPGDRVHLRESIRNALGVSP